VSLLAPRSMPDWAAMDAAGPAKPHRRPWKAPLWWAASPLVPFLGSVAGVTERHGLAAVTLDDGPDDPATPRVLAALAAHHATATFFMIVEQAERHSGVVEQVIAAGHEVALHGIDHQRLVGRPLAEVQSLISAGKRRLAAITGQPVHWFRPAYGAQDLRVRLAARRAGLDVAVWSCWARDWLDDDVDVIADRAVAGVADGGVLLLHDGYLDTDVPPAPPPAHDKGELLRLVLAGMANRGIRGSSLGNLVAGRTPRRVLWL
jgi:peptidoglycan/xylan/chitin deacetylase (PgdA/CDA1 family)